MRARTSDLAVLRQLVLDDELGFDLPFTPLRILDGGANIGLASRVFRARWPDAAIVAVELDAANAALAERNLIPHGVQVRHAGLWSREEPLQVANPLDEEWSRQATPLTPGAAAVPGLPVDVLLDELGWDSVDLLKLDIEGAEIDVLHTSARWLPRVRCLVIELHDRFRPGCAAALDAATRHGQWRRWCHGEYHLLLREPA